MNRPLMLMLSLAIGICISIFLACVNESDDDDSGSSADDDDDDDTGHDILLIDNGDGTATDPINGLMWQVGHEFGIEQWLESMNYCEDMVLAEYEDWRLPTISELRTLIRGCEKTVPGGDCGVTDDCLDLPCWSEVCVGCKGDEGPNSGNYGPWKFEYGYSNYWSSSSVPDEEGFAWGIGFDEGEIRDGDKNETEYSYFGARCVRTVN